MALKAEAEAAAAEQNRRKETVHLENGHVLEVTQACAACRKVFLSYFRSACVGRLGLDRRGLTVLGCNVCVCVCAVQLGVWLHACCRMSFGACVLPGSRRSPALNVIFRSGYLSGAQPKRETSML